MKRKNLIVYQMQNTIAVPVLGSNKLQVTVTSYFFQQLVTVSSYFYGITVTKVTHYNSIMNQ